jgi:DNA (cytosine-5)-methyltransferase 1
VNELALFAGGGGGLLASRLLGWRTVCYVEKEPYAVEILKARIRDGFLDDAPIWDDCNTFDGRPWSGAVDIVTAGFPCQPFSTAGLGLAENDPRNGWPAVARILGEIRPRYAFLENVAGLLSRPYIRRIFGDLAELGYDAEWISLSAAEVGAPHIRNRLWILAHSQGGTGELSDLPRKEEIHLGWDGIRELVADADGNEERCDAEGIQERKPQPRGRGSILHAKRGDVEEQKYEQEAERNCPSNWWTAEPRLDRVAHGVANRVDRLKAIGNGQVPEVARTAWRLLCERMNAG